MKSDKPRRNAQDDVWIHAISRARLGVWDWDLRTDKCFYSASWFEMLGYQENELTHDSDLWLRLTHPDDRERAIRSGEMHLAGNAEGIETQLRLRHKQGHWIWVLDRGGIIERDTDGRPLRVVGVQTDITQQKAAESELEQVNERFRLALEASSMGIWQFDIDTETCFWDNRTREICGVELGTGHLPRETWHAILHPDDKEMAERAHAIPVGGKATAKVRYRIVLPDGQVRHVETLAKFLDVPGTSGRLVGTIKDVTAEHARQEQLAFAALHDPLTGLFNRAAFEEALANRIAEAASRPFAIFYIDLDYFKALNDSAGHAAGDAALKAIAQRLKKTLQQSVVARLGGDEFAVLLDLSDADPEQAAESMIAAVRGHASPFGAGRTQLGASIGIAVITEPQIGAADALARADDACYAAKASGRDKWVSFSTNPSLTSGLTAARLVADLSDAKEDGRLQLFGQEIRSIETPFKTSGRIEVLARLVSRDGKFIAPCEFIPAAERFGMAGSLDRWIIRTALHKFASSLGGPKNITLGFNLSAQTLSDPMLWDFVQAAAQEAGASCGNIVFEITETAAFTNVEAAEGFVRKARNHGCRISLDDFGAGFSSFSHLRRLPITSIKIDGSFIENLTTSQFDREVVKSVAGIAEGLGYDIVAERIETLETLALLRELNIGLGQGFLLHRPEPLEQLIGRLNAQACEAITSSNYPPALIG